MLPWLAACSPPPPPASPAEAAADSGLPASPPPPSTSESTPASTPSTGACGADVVPLPLTLCAETDAAWVVDPSVTFDLEVLGAVTDVGGELARVGGPVGPFEACGRDHEQRVRLIDSDGALWTVGFGVGDSVKDDGALAAIAVGDVLSLHLRAVDYGYTVDRAVALADDVEVAWFVESFLDGPVLTATERGGIAAEVAPGGCSAAIGAWGDTGVLHSVQFTTDAGVTALASGQGALVGAARVWLAASYTLDDCAISCERTTWAGWRAP